MRLRLGLLQDPAAIEKQVQREAKEAAAKKSKAEIPTVKTEAQTKADELAEAKEKDKEADKSKKAHHPRIRPLSEAKAIETGANFISETFVFGVALGLLFIERWYSRTKENNRRSDVADKLAELETRDAEHGKSIEMMRKEMDELRVGKGTNWLWSRKPEQRIRQIPQDSKEENPQSGAIATPKDDATSGSSEPKRTSKVPVQDGQSQ